jgi:hypothetical protein
MYKNFNLSDEEKKQIMEMHKNHGYKKPVNEQEEENQNKQPQFEINSSIIGIPEYFVLTVNTGVEDEYGDTEEFDVKVFVIGGSVENVEFSEDNYNDASPEMEEMIVSFVKEKLNEISLPLSFTYNTDNDEISKY